MPLQDVSGASSRLRPVQARSFLRAPPLQAWLLPVLGPSGPSLCLSVDPPDPACGLIVASPQPSSCLWQPVFTGPASLESPQPPQPQLLPADCFRRPRSWLPASWLHPQAQRLPHTGQLRLSLARSFSSGVSASVLPTSGLDRPCYHLTLAPLDPALDSPQPPQHQLLLADGFPTPRSCLPACILPASTGPASPSQWLIGAQRFPQSGSLEPSVPLTVAHWSPVLSLQWLIGAQCFPHSGPLGPSSCLWQTSGPSSHLTLALSLGSGAPSQGIPEPSSPITDSPGPAPASRRPVQAQSFLSRPGLPRPSFCLCQAHTGPSLHLSVDPPGPACGITVASAQAQLLLLWQPVSTDPAPSLFVVPWGQADASRWPSWAQHWPADILSAQNVFSCGMKLNLDYLLEMLWEYLALTCIYTRKRGQRPDFTDAIILQKGASVEHVT
ncbi:uncharacterized protein LOC103790472 [Callithrix jacchus]